MSNPAVILNGDQIYLEELVRENARLTIQHEADRERILVLSDRVDQLEAEAAEGQDAVTACAKATERAYIAERKLADVNAMLARAIDDLHTLMAGGDGCAVCTRRCTFGTGDCKPVWKGEEAEE
ncbi:MAG: hypothetical protein NC489_21690 [Ruminococcus flavefaciens]|nr:hypothetical protein [Ruminococcus flavefaciens]